MSEQKEILFTGQEVIKIERGSEIVLCTKCNEEVAIRKEAYYDSYQKLPGERAGNPGTYVHFKCLSKERLAEINEAKEKKIEDNYSHYDYLNDHGKKFSDMLGVENITNMVLVSSTRRQMYGYKTDWEKAEVPFNKGVMIYLLTRQQPYSSQVRDTPNGWVDTGEWVVKMYNSDNEIRTALNLFP